MEFAQHIRGPDGMNTAVCVLGSSSMRRGNIWFRLENNNWLKLKWYTDKIEMII